MVYSSIKVLENHLGLLENISWSYGIIYKSDEEPVRSTETSTGVMELSIKVMDDHLGFPEHLVEWFNPL